MTTIEIQRICTTEPQPSDEQLIQWSKMALQDVHRPVEMVIRIVGEIESALLNQTYRHKEGATNILSFPVELPDEIDLNLIGDLVICAPVLEREAQSQNKPLINHWAHIVIHGTLHLLGYDHIDEEDTHTMESKEISLLNLLMIPNPYEDAQAYE
jgi:probable rRNA maturation factor